MMLLWMLLAVIACDEQKAPTNTILDSRIACQDADPDTLLLFVDNVYFEESVHLVIDIINDPRYVHCSTFEFFDEDEEEDLFSPFECSGSGPRIDQFFEDDDVEIELSGYAPDTFFLLIEIDEEVVFEEEFTPVYDVHTATSDGCTSRHGELEIIL